MDKAQKKGVNTYKTGFFSRFQKDLRVNFSLYIMIIPVAVYYILFSYVPMAGVQLAFKDYFIKRGIWGSPWVGFDHFRRFFTSYNFSSLLWNTLSLNLYSLIVGTVMPIIFSLMINYVHRAR